jgi:putative hydrolase of the HAD superfamily
MLKTAYFDLGNVLCFFSHEKMFSQLATCSGLSVENIKKMTQETGLLKSYELGSINTSALYKAFKEASPLDFSIDAFVYAISDIFTPNPEIWDVVQDLKNQSIKLVLISNTCETHYQWIFQHYPILKLFDHKILSFEEKLLKPDPKIFERALEFADCDPSECFYTDDIPAFIESAKTVGLPGEVFTDVRKLQWHLNERMTPPVC